MSRGPRVDKRCDGKFNGKYCFRKVRHRFMEVLGFCDPCWKKWEAKKVELDKCPHERTLSEAHALLSE